MSEGDDRPKVSVIVPVYNPGSAIEPAIASILGQTMKRSDYEAIFVDDGSTDGTGDRLDRLAASEPGMHVIHVAPSGAPGRPRNVGIEMARGEYVQFLDADDELAPDALARVHAVAVRNGADVVVAKFASATLERSQRLFERSIPRTTLGATPALVDGSLGPTKLFRRQFVVDNQLVFPDGWRRMEDQWFTLHAFALARTISIDAGQPAYFFRRPRAGGLTSEPIDPSDHFRNLGLLLEAVEAIVRPGPIRARTVRRLVRIEILGILADTRTGSDPATALLFETAAAFLSQRVEQPVVDALGAVERAQAAAIRDGRVGDFRALAALSGGEGLSAPLGGVAWKAADLAISATVAFAASDATLCAVAGRVVLDLPGLMSVAPPLDVTNELRPRVDAVIRNRATALEWYVPAAADAPAAPAADGEVRPVDVRVTATIDLARLAAGGPIGPGTWDVLLRLDLFGIRHKVGLGAADPGASVAGLDPGLIGDPATWVVPILDGSGLRLEVGPPEVAMATALSRRRPRLIRDGRRLVLQLPLIGTVAPTDSRVELVVMEGPTERSMPAVLRPRRGNLVIEALVGASSRLAPGSHPLVLRLGLDPATDLEVGRVRSMRPGELRVDGLARVSPADDVRTLVRWWGRSIGGSVVAARRRAATAASAAVGGGLRNLPDPARRWVRRALRRAR